MTETITGLNVLYQIWNGSSWVNTGKYLYTYDVNNNLIEQLHQSWDGFNWVNEYRDYHTLMMETII